MRTRQRIVVDTNVLISRLLAADSVPSQAVREARREGRLLVSETTMNELAEVLSAKSLIAISAWRTANSSSASSPALSNLFP